MCRINGRKTKKLIKTVSKEELIIDDNMLGELKKAKKIDIALTISKKISFNNYDSFFEGKKVINKENLIGIGSNLPNFSMEILTIEEKKENIEASQVQEISFKKNRYVTAKLNILVKMIYNHFINSEKK
jgi:hypothetical protein